MRHSDALAALRSSSMAFQAGAAGTGRLPIPDGGLPVPKLEGVTLLPGLEAPDFRGHSLAHMRALVARIAPWARVYATPGWQGPKGRCEGPLLWAGSAWSQSGVVVINSGRRGPLLLSTLLHELWHLIEPRLSLVDQMEVSLSLLNGDGVHFTDKYSGSTKEVLARAFSAYASARLLEGFNVSGVLAFDKVIEGAYSV